jgi:hypothetical protein
MNRDPLASRWLPWICGATLAGLAVAAMARDYPMVGHDYRYFIPRLLDTALHLRDNGPWIQWYSPTFGGGLPSFPNPQHLQYSAIQVATLVVNPWMAVLLVTVLAMAAGFAAGRSFLQRELGLTRGASTIGAVFFIGNGFYFEHLIVGHLGFQLFPLATVMLIVLVDRARNGWANAAALGLMIAAIIFHSGFHLIILLALSLLLTVVALDAFGLLRVGFARLAATAIGGIAVALAITGPKLHAVAALMRQFPRETADVYDAGFLQALAGLAAQLSLVMIVTPVMWVLQLDLSKVSAALMQLTGASPRMGIWEVDTAVSPVVLLCLIAGAAYVLTNRTSPRLLDRRRRYAIVALVALTWVVVEMTLARGFVYPLIQPLPVMRSLHVNVRFAAVFILPLAILAAAVFDRWLRTGWRPNLARVALVAAVLGPASYLMLPARLHFRTFDISRSIDTDRRIRAGESFTVSRMVDLDDADALAAGGSSLRPYEPLFGYALETFQPTVVLGEVSEVRDGRFNLTNPASLVFPGINNLRPFDRISVADVEGIRAFTSRGVTPWLVPSIHGSLVLLSWTTIAAAVVVLVFFQVRRRASA